MFLDSLTSGASRQLLELYDEDTRRLTTILCLPLIDGVFPSLLVGGAVSTVSESLIVSLTIFSGAGALAVLYSSTQEKSEARKMVLKASPVLVTGALAVSLIAPAFQQLFSVQMMQTVAGLALISIALDMLDVGKASMFPVPAIVVTGLALSFNASGTPVLTLEYVYPALLTSFLAVTSLYVMASLDSSRLDLNTIRKGGASVLLIIAVSQLGLKIPSSTGLVVFASALAVSYRPLKFRRNVFNDQLKIALIQINSSRDH